MAGVPSAAITQHTDSAVDQPATGARPVREQGFRGSLFGGESDSVYDMAVYDRSMARPL